MERILKNFEEGVNHFWEKGGPSFKGLGTHLFFGSFSKPLEKITPRNKNPPNKMGEV